MGKVVFRRAWHNIVAEDFFVDRTVKRFWSVVLSFVLSLAAMVPAAAAALTPAQVAQIDKAVAQMMKAQHITGLTLGVGRSGKVLFARGYGLRDRARKLPANGQTVFPIGSITKQFTAAAVMILVDRGEVQLDAPIARYVRGVPHGDEVTVRELLDQTSGLPEYLLDKKLYASILNSTVPPLTARQLVALVANKPLDFKPGSRWEYSNTNYVTLSMLVAAKSNQPYPVFLDDQILRPQHLDSTQYLKLSLPAGSDVSQGYTYGKTGSVLVKPYSMGWGGGAGALASTVGDLIDWDGAFFAGRVTSPHAVVIATTPPLNRPMVKKNDPRNGLAGGYAFGWVIGHDEGREVIWHNGGIIGARTMNSVFPHDGLEVIVLTNESSAQPEPIAMRVARILYDR